MERLVVETLRLLSYRFTANFCTEEEKPLHRFFDGDNMILELVAKGSRAKAFGWVSLTGSHSEGLFVVARTAVVHSITTRSASTTPPNTSSPATRSRPHTCSGTPER